MPRSTRTIRRVQTSHVADFDDQLWPINCAILILAGLVTGIVIATSDFHDPRLLYNGWVRLASVGVMVGLLFGGVLWLQGRMLRRLQFCLLVSLLAHLGLAVYLHERYLAMVALWETKSRNQAVEQYEQIKVPDYYWQQIEQPYAQQSFEEPIATVAPRPTDPQALKRKAEEPEIPAKTPPTEEPETPARQQPNPDVARRAVLSAPRRADAAAGAQISRQPWKDRPSPNEPVPEPEITAQPPQTAAVPDETTAPRPQTEIRVRADRVRMPEEAVSQGARLTSAYPAEGKLPPRMARREAPAGGQTTPTPTRQRTPLAEFPSAEPVTPERVAVAGTTPTAAPRVADTGASRQQADVPRVAAPVMPPRAETRDIATEVAMAVAPQARPEQTPRASSTVRAVPARRPPELEIPADLAGPPREAIARRAAPSEQPSAPIVRPRAVEVSSEADRLALAAKDTSLSSPLPPMSNTAALPSTIAARRTTASQEQPAGSEAVPAGASSLARSARGANLPSTAVAVDAQPATNPAAMGGTPESRLPTVSETAVLRSAGQPPVGSSTAAAGAADFALGSTDVVARTGQPRSAGVEQSLPTANAAVPRIARAAGRVAPTAASGVAEASPTFPAAVASSPTGPLILSLNVRDAAARRGGTVRPFAAVPGTLWVVGAGPAGSSGTPGPVGVAQSSRVTRDQSMASVVAGGGTPRPGRTPGGEVAPSITAEASEPATVAPSGGRATPAAPWQVQVSGPRRQISGLPGVLTGEPVAGALASLSDQGAPLPGAAARRAAASQQGGPGGQDVGSSRSSTIKRAAAGTDLPAAAVPIETAAKIGAGGLAVAQGGLPSSLQTGLAASLRQAAADLPVDQTTAAAGTSESDLGSAEAVAMAGQQARGVGNDVSRSNASATKRQIRPPRGYAAAIGPAIAGPGTLPTEPVAETTATGPAAETGSLAQSVAGALAAGVAKGSWRLPAAGDAEGPIAGTLPKEGAAAVAESGPSELGNVATASGRRRVAQRDEPGAAQPGQTAGGPRRPTDAPGLLSEVAGEIERPPVVAAAGVAPGRTVDLAQAAVGEPSRPEGGLPVRIAAEEGPGGLGYLPSPEVGIPSRRARPESDTIHTIFRRFVVERTGGQLAIDGRVRQEPAEAYRQREPGRRAEVAQAWGGSEGTERAVEMGLDYFARVQFPDGHWSLHELPEGVRYEDAALGEMEADSAATGLALLSYLGAGYTHLDDKYRGVVSRGIDWLVRHQKADGDLFTGGTRYARFYSHGIAAIALCEAYGMTRDPQLREPTRKAVQFIIHTQHPTRGGWRYDVDPVTGRATETDTSVSGWMLMALRSAQIAGLEVPEETFQRVNAWLDTARAAGAAGQYVYNPHALDTPEQRAGRRPNLAMTSEAMLMRMYLGYNRDDPALIAGATHLKENLPEVGTPSKPLRDCYYWYYATQAMFQMQGGYWTAWNDRLRPLATSSQVQSGPLAGSWHPLRPVEDRWGRAAGRQYVTALHLLMLEVYYRHLPLFRELGR